MNDSKKYDKFWNEAPWIFCKKIQGMGLLKKNIGDDGIWRKFVVGKISSGKSSMLNNLLGLDLDVGAGETTL